MLCLGRKAGSRERIKWKSNLSHNAGVTWSQMLTPQTQVFGETEDLVTGTRQVTVEKEGLK